MAQYTGKGLFHPAKIPCTLDQLGWSYGLVNSAWAMDPGWDSQFGKLCFYDTLVSFSPELFHWAIQL